MTSSTSIYKNQEKTIIISFGESTTGDTINYLIKNPHGYTTSIGTTFVSSTAGTVTATFSTGYFDIGGQWIVKALNTNNQKVSENLYIYVNERWEE